MQLFYRGELQQERSVFGPELGHRCDEIRLDFQDVSQMWRALSCGSTPHRDHLEAVLDGLLRRFAPEATGVKLVR